MNKRLIFVLVVCGGLFGALLPYAADPYWLAGRVTGIAGLMLFGREYAPAVLEQLRSFVDDLADD